jgi:hypothetical protein
MITKVQQFAKPIVIEFTKVEVDTDYAWNRVECQAWKWDSNTHTLTVFDEVGLECLMRTMDYCAEADEPVGFVHRYHDWKNPECPEDQRDEIRQGHLAANRTAGKIEEAGIAEMGEAEMSPARERNARIFELAAFAGSLDANELSQMSAEEILRRLNLKGRA